MIRKKCDEKIMKNSEIKSVRVLTLVLAALIFIMSAVWVWLFTDSSEEKKEVVFASLRNSKVDFNDVEIYEDSPKEGLTASFLEINEKEDLKTLEKYSCIEYLQLNDVSFDEYSGSSEIQAYYVSAKNVKKFDVSKFDKKRLQSLNLINTELSGKELEKYINLEFLHLENLKCDLSFITGKHHLKTIFLSDCDAEGYSNIGKLNGLTDLDIHNCNLKEVSWLDKCTKLENLIISGTEISEIDSVKNMKNLVSLELGNNNLSGKLDLAGLGELRNLNVSYNNLESVELDSIEGMGTVNLSYNRIKSLSENIINQAEKMKNKEFAPEINVFCNLLSNNSKLDNKVFVFRNEKNVEFTCEEHQKYIDAVRNIISEYTEESWNDAEKAIALFNYLANNLEFDTDLPENDLPPFEHISHTEYGALIKKMAVCDGFSYAYRDLLHHTGIKAIVYHGDVISTTDDEAHAWNLVKLNEKFYHCDLTFAIGIIPYVDEIRHFGISDKSMLENQYFLIDESAPKCPEDMSEEEINKIYMKVKEKGGNR